MDEAVFRYHEGMVILDREMSELRGLNRYQIQLCHLARLEIGYLNPPGLSQPEYEERHRLWQFFFGNWDGLFDHHDWRAITKSYLLAVISDGSKEPPKNDDQLLDEYLEYYKKRILHRSRTQRKSPRR